MWRLKIEFTSTFLLLNLYLTSTKSYTLRKGRDTEIHKRAQQSDKEADKDSLEDSSEVNGYPNINNKRTIEFYREFWRLLTGIYFGTGR